SRIGNEAGKPAMHTPTTIAILAMPETTASVTYGLYDLFMSAGRDWGLIVQGRPGPQLIRPVVVSAHPGPFPAANGVPLAPQATLEDANDADIVCVPEVVVAPGEPIEGRFTSEIAWLRRCYDA